MGTSFSWKMIVEKGIPKSPFRHTDQAPIDGALKSSVAGEGGGKRSRVTLPKQDEGCSDDENDEDE